MVAPDAHLLPTGVETLDRLLGGGIPARQLVLIAGYPGSGKTILAGQMAFTRAAAGASVLIATAASEPHSRILGTLQGFDFFRRDRVGREIFLLSVYPWLRKGHRETREMLLSTVRERGARLLVLDGIRSLRDEWRDESAVREFLAEVGVGLASIDCTGVLTLETSPERVLDLPEAATVDGVIAIALRRGALRPTRTVEVVKLRGHVPVPGAHPAWLGSGGFHISQRIESLPATVPAPAPPGARVPFGIDAVDEWLGGGLPAQAVTVLCGGTGTGKSLLSWAFARAAVARDERALFVPLREDGEHLRQRAAALGWDAPSGGPLEAWRPPEADEDPDGVARQVLDRAAAGRVRRVVIDGLETLGEAVGPARRDAFVTALVRHLRALRADVLLTHAGTQIVEAALGRAVDNVLTVTLDATDQEAERRLSALKVRSAPAPRRAWRFAFTSRGVEGIEARSG